MAIAHKFNIKRKGAETPEERQKRLQREQELSAAIAAKKAEEERLKAENLARYQQKLAARREGERQLRAARAFAEKKRAEMLEKIRPVEEVLGELKKLQPKTEK